MSQDQKKLLTVLESLESLTKKQASLRYAFIRGVIYGLGTVIGATVLLSVLTYFFTGMFN